MKHIIRRILKEEVNSKVINLVMDNLKSGRIKPPYFGNLMDLGLSDDEIEIILKDFTGGGINVKENKIYDKNGEIIYLEDSEGWEKRKYDDRNNPISYEDSNGYWWKREYDKNNNVIHYIASDGHWFKREYDENNKLIHSETGRNGV